MSEQEQSISLALSEQASESQNLSQASIIAAAFPLQQLDSQQEVYQYIQSVRKQTNYIITQAKFKKPEPEQQHKPQIVTPSEESKFIHQVGKHIQTPLLSQQDKDWQTEVISNFKTIKSNIIYLQKHSPSPSSCSLPTLKHIYSSPPLIHSLSHLQYKQILKLISLISTNHSKSPTPQTNSYNACLWLYSLLALFRVSGGVKYHEIISGINTICKRDKSDGAKVLKTIMIHEFGQMHLR